MYTMEQNEKYLGRNYIMRRDELEDFSKYYPRESVSEYKKAIKRRPQDQNMKINYIKTLILLGKFDQAEKMIYQLEDMFDYAEEYHFNEAYIEYLNNQIVSLKTQLYIYQGRNQELFELFETNKEEFKHIEKDVKYYILKLQGKLTYEVDRKSEYFVRQIFEYDEDDFRHHMKKHVYGGRSDNQFNEDFPVDDVIEMVKERIPSDFRLNPAFYTNAYYFKYDRCGNDHGEETDYFKVITLNNTNHILNMLPVSGVENYPFIDLNELNKQEEVKPYVKKISQIDRFNRRYNIGI